MSKCVLHASYVDTPLNWWENLCQKCYLINKSNITYERLRFTNGTSYLYYVECSGETKIRVDNPSHFNVFDLDKMRFEQISNCSICIKF